MPNVRHTEQKSAAPCKMLATPCIMSAMTHTKRAARHIVFAKDHRWGLRCSPGDPPIPIHEKTLVSRNDF